MEKIGIFGGTYNPPHVGHLNIVSKFVEDYELDRVLIIPTFVPPHKSAPDLASSEDRIEMCKRTFRDPIYEVSAVEIDRQGKSYTYDTLRELKGMYKKAEFFFLCGDDMLMSLHTWYKPARILDLTTIVAAVRSNAYTNEDLEAYAIKHFPAEFQEGKIKLMPIEPLELSSSSIREKRKNGESIEGLVTDETLEFINDGGLYL